MFGNLSVQLLKLIILPLLNLYYLETQSYLKNIAKYTIVMVISRKFLFLINAFACFFPHMTAIKQHNLTYSYNFILLRMLPNINAEYKKCYKNNMC